MRFDPSSLLTSARPYVSEIPSAATPHPLDELCRAVANQVHHGDDPYQAAFGCLQTRITLGSIGCSDIQSCARAMALALGVVAARAERPSRDVIERTLASARLGIEAAEKLFAEVRRG